MFIVAGPVTGTCGHQHKTLKGAKDCQTSHNHAMNTRGGLRDRKIYRLEDVALDAGGAVRFALGPVAWRDVDGYAGEED
jgi:hypothetical protein